MADNKPTVFVITPFREEMLQLYEHLKHTFEDEFRFTNGGDLETQQCIIRDIVEGINQADVVIADLTGMNANVFYELGLAHAMNKKVVCITQDVGELPFDIKSYRTVEYSMLFYRLPKLIDDLRRLLRGAIDGGVIYGNPVADYLPSLFESNASGDTIVPSVDESRDNSDEDSQRSDDFTEAGYLDYIADIAENAASLTAEVDGMSSGLQIMNESVNHATSEIERVKRQSGNAPISFVRSTCRNLAEPVDKCAQRIREHLVVIEDKWTVVENSYLGLFSNKFTQKTGDRAGINSSLSALRDLKVSMQNTKGNVGGLISVLQDNLGIERRLTKAITSLVTELEVYLSMTDTMSASIDRIIAKGETVFPNN